MDLDYLLIEPDAKTVAEQRPAVERFCTLYNVEVTRIGVTWEEGVPEPAYEFSFGEPLGYFTIAGVRQSVRESTEKEM